jgi:hypothetical protein
MCAVIVAAKNLTAFEATGINYLIEDYLQLGSLEEKTAIYEYIHSCDHLFPMGPT